MYRCTIQDNCPTSTAKLSQYVEVEVFLINCLALRILVGTINCLRNLARQLPGQLSTMDIVPAGAIESPRLFCCCCCCDNCLSGQLPHATQGGGIAPAIIHTLLRWTSHQIWHILLLEQSCLRRHAAYLRSWTIVPCPPYCAGS